MTRFFLLIATLVAALPLHAEEATLCYNYGCAAKVAIRFSADDLKRVQTLFAAADDAAAERRAIADAMVVFYAAAGTQAPVWRDRGGNVDDDDADGRMDCIDHSNNTTAWLHVISRQGWLKHHEVGDRVKRRRLIFEHWSARIVEAGSSAQFVVDTWFLDPGLPAVVWPLDRWLDGAYPSATATLRWNRN